MDSVQTQQQPLNVNGFFAISPKLDCPHQATLNFAEIISQIQADLLKKPCEDCDITEENWMCLECNRLGCSRYFNSHMVKHTEQTGHKVALSFSDGSFWCYPCESYVHSKELGAVQKHFSKTKFPETGKNADMDMNSLAQIFKDLSTLEKKGQEKIKFTKEDLVEGIKKKRFNKIIFLTGAGISVSAGIPDFRSPGTGLYANLAKYNLPKPEAVFDLAYFKENPEPFYKLEKDFFGKKVSPVISHHFIKMLQDEGQLFLSFTQNIDGLEVEAGVDTKYMIEAHGHYRTAHCLDCNKEHPIKEFLKHVEEQIIHKCECSGLVKPDIIFFGEDMPKRFIENVENIDKGDLVIVMGTSLKVLPFAALVTMVPQNVPIVYINRENTKIYRDNFLFMEGSIDDQVHELIKELGWESKLENIKKASTTADDEI